MPVSGSDDELEDWLVSSSFVSSFSGVILLGLSSSFSVFDWKNLLTHLALSAILAEPEKENKKQLIIHVQLVRTATTCALKQVIQWMNFFVINGLIK